MKATTILFGAIALASIAARVGAQQPTGNDAVDTNKVQTVNDWAKRRGATEIWVNNPQANARTPQARVTSPAGTIGAEPMVRHADASPRPRHVSKAKKKTAKRYFVPADPASSQSQ